MRDISLPYRNAIAAAISGVISVPVYDEKRWVQDTDTKYVLLTTQQQTPVDDNDCTWISRASIDLEIYHKSGSEVTKNDIDNISNEICKILLPAPFTTVLSSPNLLFQNAYFESIISRNISLSETESILIKILRFVCVITQQS